MTVKKPEILILRTENPRRAALTALVLLGAGLSASNSQAAFEVDGAFGGAAEGYSLGYEISFALEGGDIVDGGRVYFGTQESGADAGHYLYFAMPKDFVDNSWGSNSVGWGRREHTLKHLVGSDSLGKDSKFVLNPVNTAGATLDLQIDYLATDNKRDPSFYRSGGIGTVENNGTQDNTRLRQNDGAVAAGDASGVLEIATSAEYNLARFASQSDLDATSERNPVGVFRDSPDVLVDSDGNAVDQAGNRLAAGDDYVCSDAGDATCAGWVFDVGYEMRFDLDMFDSGWTDGSQALVEVDSNTGEVALTFVDLGEAHVSPNKGGTFQDIIVGNCILGDDCDGGPGGGGGISVPEPGTGLLLAMGLAGIGYSRRRMNP